MRSVLESLFGHNRKTPLWLRAILWLVLAALLAQYALSAARHGREHNLNLDYNDQKVYMNYAMYIAERGWDVFVTRMRMPLYMWILAPASRPNLTTEQFFPIAQHYGVGLSLVLLAAMFFTLWRWLGTWIGIAFIFVAGAQVYMLRSTYIQPELTLTTIITITVAWLAYSLQHPSWRTGLLSGLLLCLWFLTKASAQAVLGLFGLFLGWKWLLAPKGQKMPYIICGLVTLVGYFLPMSSYLATSYKYFGDPFYNVQGKYYMWAQDVDEKHLLQKTGLDRNLDYFTVTSGGDRVLVTMTGNQDIKEVVISPELAEPDQIPRLQSLISAAVHDALLKSKGGPVSSSGEDDDDTKPPPGSPSAQESSGKVTVSAANPLQLTAIHIDPDLVKPHDAKLLEDLTLQAFQQALLRKGVVVTANNKRQIQSLEIGTDLADKDRASEVSKLLSAATRQVMNQAKSASPATPSAAFSQPMEGSAKDGAVTVAFAAPRRVSAVHIIKTDLLPANHASMVEHQYKSALQHALEIPELPSFGKYWREHPWRTASQDRGSKNLRKIGIKDRLDHGIYLMFSDAFTEYLGYYYLVGVWTCAALLALALCWEQGWPLLWRLKWELLFAIVVVTAFSYLFGWFIPIKAGPRLINSVGIIPLFFAAALTHRLLKDRSVRWLGAELSVEKLTATALLLFWVAVTLYRTSWDLQFGYFGG